MGTTTFTENQGRTPRSTWTISATGSNITCVNGETKASRKIAFATPSVKATKSNTDSNKKYGIANIYGHLLCNGTNLNGYATYYRGDNANNMPTIAVGTQYTLTKNESGSIRATYTEDIFTASNKTVKTVPIYFHIDEVWLASDTAKSESSNNSWKEGDVSVNVQFANLTLNAPPTATVSAIYYNKSVIYANYTTASVDVSDLTAYFGGDISSVVFTVGSQTASRTTNGTLSIALNAVGSFTPTVKVTDSRGQTKTYTLPQIVVKEYTQPTVSFPTAIQRVNSSGVPNDEGESALFTANFGWTSEIASLTAPTVSVTDLDGNAVTATTTWYSDSALTTSISDWSSLTANDMPVYGLIDNSNHDAFNTQLSYQIAVTPNDTRDSGTTITQTLGSAFYTIDFLAGGHGIAFGQPSSSEGFYCNMDAYFKDKANQMRALFDFVYPVGSYYETSDATFDPNTAWGGTWSLEAEGLVHIGAGSNYTLGDTGGNKDAIIPYHNHKGVDGLYFVTENYDTAGGIGEVRVTATTSGSNYVPRNTSSSVDFAAKQSTAYAGTKGNTSDANMQPYIVVNRWHRTA